MMIANKCSARVCQMGGLVRVSGYRQVGEWLIVLLEGVWIINSS